MPKAEEPKKISDMNIYERLQRLKVDVAETIKGKSGKNDFKGFNYLELTDFLPQTNKMEIEYGLSSKMEPFILMDKETGLSTDCLRLKIVCFDNPGEGLTWELPIKGAAIQGATEIQNFGGALTYTRRYLWMLALDLAVPDVIDPQTGSGKLVEGSGKKIPLATEKQKGMIASLETATLEELLKRINKSSIDELTVAEASSIIKWMKGRNNNV